MKINHLFIKFKVLNINFKNIIIPLVQNLTQLKEFIISLCFSFAQIYKPFGYGQYKMHGSVIMVLTNVDQNQSYYHIYHTMIQQ
jgi:hypothetical protein